MPVLVYIIRFVRYLFRVLVGILVVAGVLFYLPPVQAWLGAKACELAESAIGIPVEVRKLRIVFPFNLRLEGVAVSDHSLKVEHLTLKTSISRLLDGNLSADELALGGVQMRSGDLLDGVVLDGTVGTVRVKAKRWDLSSRTLLVNDLQLGQADVQLSLRDTSEVSQDTSSASFLKEITLVRGGLRDVRFSLRMPDGGVRLFADIDTLLVRRAEIGLQEKKYNVREVALAAPALFFALENDSVQGGRPDSLSLFLRGSRLLARSVRVDLDEGLYHLDGLRYAAQEIAYHANQKPPLDGFDPEHLTLASVFLETGVLGMERGKYVARVNRMNVCERNGIYINKVEGEALYREGEGLVADLVVQTPHSHIRINGKLRDYLWNGEGIDGESMFVYDIKVGYRDMRMLSSLFMGMPGGSLPARDLLAGGRMTGKGRVLTLHGTEALLPGVFRLSANGSFDFEKEAVSGNLLTEGTDLNRLLPWMMGQGDEGQEAGGGLRFPRDLRLQAGVQGRGDNYKLVAELTDSIGKVGLEGAYNARNESYDARLVLDSLWVNNYYALDSVTDVSAELQLSGRGTDFYDSRTQMALDFSLKRIGFHRGQLRSIRSQAQLESNQVHVELEANNLLLNMDAQLDAQLYRAKPIVADLSLDIWDADLKAVGLVNENPDQPFGVSLNARLEEDMTSVALQTGDFSFFFDGRSHFSLLQKQITELAALLQTQLAERDPDQGKLKKLFPEAQLLFRAGGNNIINYILKERTSLSPGKVGLQLKTSPETGISGEGYCYALQAAEEFTLDTLLLRIVQDSLGIGIFTSFVNSPDNPSYSFRAQLNTLLSDHEGKVRVYMRDSEGNVGVNLGLHGRMQGNGYHVSFYPNEPIVAFRQMQLNRDNEIWIRQEDGRIFADVRMRETDEGNSAISITSNDSTQAEQDLSFSVAHVDVADVVRSFPFLPDIGGILDATVSIRKRNRLRFSIDSRLQDGLFNGMDLGDIALRGGYMPDSLFDTHSVAAQLTRNGERMVSVAAKFRSESSELLSSLVTVHGIPLELFNGFVPDYKTNFYGTLAGALSAVGTLENPVINGELHFDSSHVVIPAASLHLALDTQKIYVRDNVLHFQDYGIYASGEEPFRIEGTVSVEDFSAMPVADLTLEADNYQLINRRKRDRNTLLLGKLVVGLNTTVKGPLDHLRMRGNMHILGATDLTYIMENSPLTVEDQLNEQLTFVDFSDTLSAANLPDSLAAFAAYRPSTLDMLLQLTIDPTVRMRVELTRDGESYVDLEGGGNLTLQATPLNDLSLNGRYSLNSGSLKYAFSMIPLKEFALQSGSYVAWNGNLMNPSLHLTAVETIRSTVTDEDNQSRGVNFEISINLSNTLENLSVSFDIAAPQDAAMQEELNALTAEERSKQAITTLAMGTYTGSSGGGLRVNDALNSLLQSQINSLAGNVLKSTDLSIGMNSYSSDGTGGQSTEYTYKFARRFWNNRIRVVIGGTITQGANTANQGESFIDNISIEYNIDEVGTKSARIYYNKNYESILEGEIIKTGAGFVYRKKLNTLRELLPWHKFRRKESEETENDEKQE